MSVSLLDYPNLIDVIGIQVIFKVTVDSACFDADIHFQESIETFIYEAGHDPLR